MGCPEVMVNWPNTMSVVKDLTLSFAAAFSAIIAWRGLNRWRLEQAGKVHFEVARQLARATYKLRNSMNDARAILVSSNEFPAEYDRIKHTDREEADAWGYVFSQRYKYLRDTALELQTVELEAEVLWGNDVKQRTNALLQCVTRLRLAMEEHVRQLARGGPKGPDQVEIYRQTEDIIFGSTDFPAADSPFTERLKTALNDMEDFLKEHLARFRIEK